MTEKRPRVLETLCLLSFAGSGGAMLFYLSCAIFYSKASQIIIQYSSIHSAGLVPPGYFLLLAGLHSLSLAGAIQMWYLKKRGYFVYAAAQLSILALPLVWIGKDAFSAVAMIFMVIFLVMYSIQARHLK